MRLNEQAPKGKYEELPLAEWTEEELKSTKLQVMSDVAELELQLNLDYSEYQETGVGDLRWRSETKAVISRKHIFEKKLDMELAGRKTQKKQGNITRANNEDRWFRRAAHHYLSGAEFEAIEALALKMAGGSFDT